MKKLLIVSLILTGSILTSCGNHSEKPEAPTDSVNTGSSNNFDSAANNGILPPSASPDNTNNSSLADTAYPAKDSSKK